MLPQPLRLSLHGGPMVSFSWESSRASQPEDPQGVATVSAWLSVGRDREGIPLQGRESGSQESCDTLHRSLQSPAHLGEAGSLLRVTPLAGCLCGREDSGVSHQWKCHLTLRSHGAEGDRCTVLSTQPREAQLLSSSSGASSRAAEPVSPGTAIFFLFSFFFSFFLGVCVCGLHVAGEEM